jgi:hypothetical protein
MQNNYFIYDETLCNNPPKLTQSSSRPNSTTGFNQGYSSKLKYDEDYLRDSIQVSTGPINSQMDANRIRNCKQCFSTNGPRSSYYGWGDNLPIQNPGVCPAQQVMDIDSIMKNLNTKSSRSSKGGLNPVDVFKFTTYNNVECNKFLDPVALQLTQPRTLAREQSINRFYDLNKNPQQHIYYNWSQNTYLEAIDNYRTPYPASLNNVNANELKETTMPNKIIQPPHYVKPCNLQVFDSRTYPKVNKIINPDLKTNDDIMTDSDSDNDSN